MPTAAPAPTSPLVIKGTSSRKTKTYSLPVIGWVVDRGDPDPIAPFDYTVTVSGKSKANYSGDRCYDLVAVVLYTSDGGYEDLLVNEIVPKCGKWSFETEVYALGFGVYYFDVGAPAGGWTITITPQL
ncbi:MAG: hypothetical protein ABI628_10580 [Chloroflexota bacterium]